MGFVSVGIIVLIIISSIGGKYHGVMNKVFTFEKWALIILLLPGILSFLPEQLMKFIPYQLPEFIAIFISVFVLYVITNWGFRLITGLVKEEATVIDNLLGFLMGGLKMFLLLAILISLYGTCFLDRHIPFATVSYFKNNIINQMIKHEVEYYRKKAYNSYKWIKESDIYDVTKSKSNVVTLPDGTTEKVNNISHKTIKKVILPPYLPKYSWLIDD